MTNISAWIFDMDGVIVDTNPFHKQAWMSYAQELGKNISEEWMHEHVYGRINREALTALLGTPPTEAELVEHTQRKEALFIESYRPHISMVPGLDKVLSEARQEGISLAVATSAPRMNVEFIFQELGLAEFFPVVIDDQMVEKGKPDPEIYLHAAHALGVAPSECLVFEDSFSGVKAGLAAGMKVIALSTTHSAEEFDGVEMVMPDFSHFTIEDWIHQR